MSPVRLQTGGETVKRVWLLRWAVDDTFTEFKLGPGSQVLGSAQGVDLRINDPTVSRRHVRLTASDDGVRVEDLHSTNGTFVDGDRVDEPTMVTDLVELKVGTAVMELAPGDKPSGVKSPSLSGASSGASMLLGPATVGFLRDAGQEVTFSESDVIVRRGEHQDFFHVVIEGTVELLLTEGDRTRPLARLGEGGIFGAESVLGKEGAAIDAVAVTDVRLLRYPASALPTALKESASLRQKLLGGFARNLHKTTSDALDLMHGADVMARLVQGDSDPDELIAASPRMKSIRKKIPSYGELQLPTLITGEDGTGKTQIARLIHDASPRSDGPLIAVNCHDLTPGHAAELILGEDLGGRLPTGDHGSGGIHLAHGGTLVLRGADALEPAVQQMLAAFLTGEKLKPPGSFPDTRVIVTARSAKAGGETREGLTQALIDCFEVVIEIPPLAKRIKDVLPLAEEFLKRHGPDSPVITEEARHALLSLRYQRRNVAELREVLDLAVRVADGKEIRAEHIFGGVGEDAAPPGIDVTSSSLVQTLLRTMSLPLLRGATLVGFGAVIALCLAATSTPAGRVANTAIWSLWEPVVFGLFFVIGPIWCTICPLSTAARFAKRLGSLERQPPAWLVKHGPWLAIIGFALIIWVERVFNSAENPVASGILLISLVVSAVLGALLFRGEGWCRHLCPLGRLATTLAPVSPLQVTAKQRVCASTCTTHACYKGTPEIAGCTVFHHPLEGQQAYRCKLCLDCLQSCPHHSAQLQIRAPLIAVWRLDSRATDLAMFASAVSLLALGLVASRAFEVLSQPLHFTILCILALAAGIAIHHTITAIAHTDRRVGQMVQLSVTMMIVGWAALMTSQLANIVILNEARIAFELPDWAPIWVPVEISLLLLLQVGLVLAAFVLALFALSQIPFEGTTLWTRLGRRLTPLLVTGYTVVVVSLLLYQ